MRLDRAKPEESVKRVMGRSGSKGRRIGAEVNRDFRRSKADWVVDVQLKGWSLWRSDVIGRMTREYPSMNRQ